MATMLPGGGIVTGFRPNAGDNPYVESVVTGDYDGNVNASATALSEATGEGFDKYLNYLESRAKTGDDAAIDKLFDYYATERSNKTARDWTSQREDTQYQRLMEDLRKAGISPYIMSSAVPGVSSSSGSSHTGSQLATQGNNRFTARTNIARSVLTLTGTALALLLHALFI